MGSLERIGKYRVRREIGRGSTGIVYEAWDTVIERRVALKVLHIDASLDEPSHEISRRFRREAQAAGRLSSPYVVAVYDFGEDPDESVLFIAMEFVDGLDLRSHLASGRRFALDETAQIIRELLSALQHAHSKGIVHRDIKPANILLQKDGTVKVADFGIAKFDTSELTQTGAVLGTVSHMSPEQLNGLPVDARSDIFSSAVVLYQLLTGVRPFTGSAATVVRNVLEADAVPPSMINATLPPGLDDVIKRAMSKRAEDRHASAKAFSDAFALAVAEHMSTEPTPQAAQLHRQAAKEVRQDKAGPPLAVEDVKVAPVTSAGADEIDQDQTIATSGPRSLLPPRVDVGTVPFASLGVGSRSPFAAGPTEKETGLRPESPPDPPAEASTQRFGSKARVLLGAALVAAMAVAWLALKKPGVADGEVRVPAADQNVASAASPADRVVTPPIASVRLEPTPTEPAASLAAGKTTVATSGMPSATPSVAASDVALEQRTRLAEQKERKDWAAARKLDTEVGYRSFMNTHPESMSIPAAKARVLALAKAEAAAKAASAQADAEAREADRAKADRHAALAEEVARMNAADAAAAAAARTAQRPTSSGQSSKPVVTVKPVTELPTAVTKTAPATTAGPTAVVSNGLPDCQDKLPACQVRIGWAYLDGKGVARDPTQAFDWFKRASDSGNLDGQVQLANLYDRGLGVAKNEVLALELARKASDQGDPRAMNFIGNYYLKGVGGVLENKVLAADWFAKSAEKGNPFAQANLGYAYLFARGVFKNTDKATELFKKAMAQRNAWGYYYLGLMYETGNGQERNVGEAVRLYKEALRLGGLSKANADRAQAFIAVN